jgi:hypothetical protein
MPARMRFRTDGVHVAADAARLARGKPMEWHRPSDLWLVSRVPPAQPGDCWRVRWHGSDAIAGYALGCVKCGDVHYWTTALNCSQPKRSYTYVDRDGTTKTGYADYHSGNGSCWTWTGSAEGGTLTASPSLHCLADKGGCGYHGWLQNGILSDG